MEKEAKSPQAKGDSRREKSPKKKKKSPSSSRSSERSHRSSSAKGSYSDSQPSSTQSPPKKPKSPPSASITPARDVKRERRSSKKLKAPVSPLASPAKNVLKQQSTDAQSESLNLRRTDNSRTKSQPRKIHDLSSATSGDLSVSSDGPVRSVTKTLAQLQAVPANRCCADCRSPFLDSSQTFVSFTPSLGELPSLPHAPSAVGEFSYHHDAFAPPGAKSRKEEPVDPATRATLLTGGFGVFVCAACGAAHKSLGPTIAYVHSAIDTSWWTPDQVDFLLKVGGNARNTALERFMPESWEKRRPTHSSTLAERQMFVRAKYDALAFLVPPGGPLSAPAWSKLVRSKPELQRWSTKELESYPRITISGRESSNTITSGSSDSALPSRLVDFFCVVGHSGKLAQFELKQNLAERNSPEDLCFDVAVTDCYPVPEAHSDMDFPQHVSTFVFPDGCRPSQVQHAPTFFTFVLTSANGQRLYGAAMHVYEEQMDTSYIRNVIRDSGYTAPFPWWLHDEPMSPKAGTKLPSELVYMPKCLVLLSHYPFFDIWRKFLTMLYRITMVEAPLPIERYIANFVSEVPLPPQGKVEVKFAFTTGDLWSIKRPSVNKLPLNSFSYLPLFASLSVGNILVVSGCLMQETRVALLSSHYSLLTPVAEALLSLLFPFEWQGMYIPIMPFAMLDILDAPVPFLVGLHSRYLANVPSRYRPKGVVFVNLDTDEVHLGFDDEGALGNATNSSYRFAPALPERDSLKLKAKLDEFGESVYLYPSTKVKGRVLTGDGDDVQNSTRPSYSKWESLDLKASAPRMRTFRKADSAFPDGQQLDPISGFLSEQGHTSGMVATDEAPKAKGKARNAGNRLKKLGRKIDLGKSASNDSKDDVVNSCLLDMEEPEGFNVDEIRNAFLRFFVSVFNGYEKYLGKDLDSERFRGDDFVESLGLPSGQQRFVSNILATQMFQRFIQERKANPSSPAVLFFDQSIIAKNNRSKKTTLTGGGKQKTPFLDDTSMQIQEVFTPPSPSNWGLPGDGRRYHYGTFPRLQADLFGKVRAPKQWPQQDAGTYRVVAQAALKKQQELIAKALGRGSSFPAVVGNSVRRSTVRDMEWAILLLSKEETADSTNEGKIESRATAQKQVLAARRKQAILIDIVITIQAYCRMHIAIRRYKEHRKALISLQRRSRRTSPLKEQQTFRDTVECAVLIQSFARLRSARNQYDSLRRSTIVVQRLSRGVAARQQYRKLKAVLFLQRWVRGSLVRCYVSRLKKSTIMTQAIVRGRRSRFGCSLLMVEVSKLQALARGYLTRKTMSGLIKKRTSRFKQQIFLLWQHAHTPLAYRTKMWPLLDGSGFLSLTLAEGELQRLWSELDVRFPPSPRNNSLLKSDDHLALALRMGLSSPCYLRFVKVQAMIEAGRQNDGTIPWFTAEGSPHWTKSAEREKLERLQVYERLHAETDKETLEAIYKYFEINSADKMKKRTLVDRLWDIQTHASRSVTVMLALFPELEYGTYMNFVSPSKKGQKLYHVKNKVPSPLDSSMQVEVIRNQLVKSNMKEFAMAHADKVPGLLSRLDEREKMKNVRFMLQQRAEMYARKIPEWPRCRRKIILDFLYPGRKSTKRSKSKRRSRKN